MTKHFPSYRPKIEKKMGEIKSDWFLSLSPPPTPLPLPPPSSPLPQPPSPLLSSLSHPQRDISQDYSSTVCKIDSFRHGSGSCCEVMGLHCRKYCFNGTVPIATYRYNGYNSIVPIATYRYNGYNGMVPIATYCFNAAITASCL